MWPVIGTITSSATKREYVFQQIYEKSHVCSNFCKTFHITSSTSKFRRKSSNSKHKEHIWRNHHHMQFHFQNSVTKRPTTPPKTNQSVSKETTILNSFTLNIWFGVWKIHHGSWGSDFSLPFFVSCRWLLPSILEAQLSPPRVALEYPISVDPPRIKGTS